MVLNKTRIKWIDSAKGIGILLVVFGHNSLPPYIMSHIFSFHMPFFFLISGFLLTQKKTSFKELIIKKGKSLLIPYFSFALLTYLFWLIIGSKIDPDDGAVDKLIPFFGIFYGNGIDPWLMFNAPLWFLPCLFIVEVIYFFLKKFSTNDKTLFLYLVIMSVIGYLDSILMPFRLPWSIDVSLTAVVFFGIGNLLKKHNLFLDVLIPYKSKVILIFFLCLILNILITFINGSVDMNNIKLNNYFYFYIGALSGIIPYLVLSYKVQNLKFLDFLGRNTLIIMCLHILALKITKGIFVLGFNIPLEATRNSFVWSSIWTIGALILLLPVIYIINNFFPFLIGKKFKISNK